MNLLIKSLKDSAGVAEVAEVEVDLVMMILIKLSIELVDQLSDLLGKLSPSYISDFPRNTLWCIPGYSVWLHCLTCYS